MMATTATLQPAHESGAGLRPVSSRYSQPNDPNASINLLSSDGIMFFARRDILAPKSANNFGGLLNETTLEPKPFPYKANILHLILACFYADDLPQQLTINELSLFLSGLLEYGLDKSVLEDDRAISQIFENIAGDRPVDAFALACHYNLESLAVILSRNMATLPLQSISEEQSITMGAIYFLRLVQLHVERDQKIKELVTEFPVCANPSPACSTVNASLHRLWRDAALEFVFTGSGIASCSTIQRQFSPITPSIACPDCKVASAKRIQIILDDWASFRSVI